MEPSLASGSLDNTEVLWEVGSYVQQATPGKPEAILAAMRGGQVELNGLFGNELTGLCRPEELFRLTDGQSGGRTHGPAGGNRHDQRCAGLHLGPRARVARGDVLGVRATLGRQSFRSSAATSRRTGKSGERSSSRAWPRGSGRRCGRLVRSGRLRVGEYFTCPAATPIPRSAAAAA